MNGLFNDRKQAERNLQVFQQSTRPALSDVKGLKYDLAWVEGMWKPLHLATAMVQRGVDDFQRYWLWLYGLEKAPAWFENLIKSTIMDPKFLDLSALPRLEEHMELYSNAVLEGYNVVIVSHSVGSFYANAALRTLPGYTPASLKPAIADRKKENPYYPGFEELVTNVQIASPAGETVNGSPWVSFKDDQVLGWLRSAVNVLPGNVGSAGVSAHDVRGHSLIPSYLRVAETRNAIIGHMKAAIARMRYPIPYSARAATVEYLSVIAGRSMPSFGARFFMNETDITAVAERSEAKRDGYQQFMAKCYDLRPGAVDIRAETIFDSPSAKNFRAMAYIGAAGSSGARALQMTNGTAISYWRLGRIQVSPGKAKDPIEADAQYLDQPELLVK